MSSHTPFFIAGPKPQGLSIKRDKAGIPHIQASDTKGISWGMGYCHAIDRGTQLLMMRILGQGRLSELLSDNDESVAIDTFFRSANWGAHIDEQIALLDSATLEACQAYCDGVNAGLQAKRAWVLRFLGYSPEPWTIQNSILILRMAGYLTLAQSQGEVERLFVEMVQAGIDTEKLESLFPGSTKNLNREQIEDVSLGECIVPKEVLWKSAIPRMMASNNWVIAGDKTASKSPIMANDPHLEVNRLPNVWYEQSIQWQDRQILGMGMPGVPGIIIGRSKKVSWGATYTFMDTVDSWIENCQGGCYEREHQWHPFTVRKETIKRKKHVDVEVTFYENQHGVLDGNPNQAGKYLATRWSPAQSGAQTLMASMQLINADTAEQAMKHLGDIESAWNWVIADTEGNIAYQMSGLMPIRHPQWNGFSPAPGWDPAYDWQGFVNPIDLPRSLNPKEGYLVTANQDLNHLGKTDPINMPMGDYRAKRIESVLAASNNHTVESTKTLQFDVYSQQADLFLDILLPLLKQVGDSRAKSILENWDRQYDLKSIGAPLFEIFYSALRKETFGNEMLGSEIVDHLTEKTGIFIDFYQNFDRAMLNENSGWFANKNNPRTRDETFLEAFAIAQKIFEQQSKPTQWQDQNKVTFVNQIFQGKLPAIFGFDTRPIPLMGGRATPHQGQIYESNGRSTSFAPSVRLITDMSESTLHTCLAGGPSDSRFSKWYKSGVKDWILGNYKTLRLNQEINEEQPLRRSVTSP